MSASGVPIPVGPLYGSLFFSSILSVGFYGVACMQTFFYYIHYQDDTVSQKTLVAILWALGTIHQSLVISGVYKYIMAGLMNPNSFLDVVPELTWELLLTTLVSVPTQGFFVYRIYLFAEKNIIAPLIWLPLGIFQLVAALLYVGKGSHVGSLAVLGDTFFTDLSYAYCSVAAGVDIGIAICLTYLLTRKRIATEFKHTAKILQLLSVFAINSGIWTAVFALLTIVLLRAFPKDLIYVVFDFPLCSIYCNTLLANFNARAYIKNQFITHNVGADLMSVSEDSATKFPAESIELKFFTSTNQESTKHSEPTSMTTVVGPT